MSLVPFNVIEPIGMFKAQFLVGLSPCGFEANPIFFASREVGANIKAFISSLLFENYILAIY
jgi:hypothetical protein